LAEIGGELKTSDWDDPSIRAVGRKWAAEAYDLASELHDRGADASPLVKSRQWDPKRPHEICLPTLVDVVMAILLMLPRQAGAPDQPLAENIVTLRKVK
jgi:hypothetical protein